MTIGPSSVRVGVDVSLAPKRAFETLTDEMQLSLKNRGISLDAASPHGKILEGETVVGTVREWKPGKRISLAWHPKTWENKTSSRLVIAFKPNRRGTMVTLELKDWGHVLGDDEEELLGWFASEVVGPLFSASAPSRLGDWITDRSARRPSGSRSRRVYKNPTHHWPNFYAILDVLALSSTDNLLEIGCGGGAFLQEALKSGCRASAIDHSDDMVKLAAEVNRKSVAESRLKITTSEADSLPYPDATFTCAVMTGVLGFLPDALQTFRETCRVLKSQGRFVAFTGSKSVRDTRAAPEPVASRLHFYEDSELEDLARQAGFASAKVEHPSLYEYAKKAGVPKPDLELFKGPGASSQLLIAQRA